ncbi:unnamed protein product [Phytomonas sp. EM1]|nr:unnamed protein product [Phytomonas sp. EM1]|eukprot:CCW63495.1 unnamed protein product [Phytomonas sp. isolate EM1]
MSVFCHAGCEDRISSSLKHAIYFIIMESNAAIYLSIYTNTVCGPFFPLSIMDSFISSFFFLRVYNRIMLVTTNSAFASPSSC